jgi:argininosuccinate synthase
LTYYALKPDVKVIAPWREWSFKSRTDLIDYAEKHGIPVPVSKSKPYSSDRNLLNISFEGGILEDPWKEPPEDKFLLTKSPEKAPDKPTYVEIEYEKGNPVAINGKKLSPYALLAELNQIAGENGIGRVDLVENRFVGMKSRGVYETPGGTVLHAAHRAVESITLDREVLRIRDSLIPQYAAMVYNGFWYSPERELLQNMIDDSQQKVSGTARLKLYKGNCLVVGRKSPNSLFSEAFATFEKDTVYNQKDAEGFIRLNALRLRIRNLLQK